MKAQSIFAAVLIPVFAVTAQPALLSTYVFPGATDPALTNFNDPHFVAVAANSGLWRNKLLLHLPGSGHEPWQATNFIRTAAALGYHAVSIKYQNVPSIGSMCGVNTNLDCYRAVAEENITGAVWADGDPLAIKQVSLTDSITNRVVKLLMYLATNPPTAGGNWAQFLGPAGIQWSNVAVSGHSQGGSGALLLSKQHLVDRAILFATVDWIQSPITDRPPWFAVPGITPPERLYGFTHLHDFGGNNNDGQLIIWQDLGLDAFGPVLLVESNAPPYSDTHQLTSNLTPATTNQNGGFEYHASVIIDRAIPTNASASVTWLPVWSYMLTNVTPPLPCLAPVLQIQQSSPTEAEVTWFACRDAAYQLEWSSNLVAWYNASPPLAAPLGGWRTNVVDLPLTREFFRLRQLTLTNSVVPTSPGTYALHMVSAGIPRYYRLTIPTNYNAALPSPLALIFHGSDQTANSFAAQHPSLMSQANAQGVILVVPDSTAHERGTGWWFGPAAVPGAPAVDDVAFVLDLIERLAASLNIDRKRVYAGGFSNGGQLCHYLAGQTTNVFAAIAAVGSAIAGAQGNPTNLVYPPLPPMPMPALIVNATNDCARPYWGGQNDDGNLQPAVWEAVAHYTNANLCVATSTLRTNAAITNFVSRFKAECGGPYPPPATVITNLVIRETFITCATGTEVALVTLTDGGHKWPDPEDRVGFDANREVLEFFLQHCRCEAVGATNWLTIPTTPGQYLREFCDQGYWRTFRLAIPTNYTGASERPLLFTFHGGSETMAEFSAQHPDLFTKCNTEGVLLVLPEATRHPQSLDTLWGNKPFDIVVDDRAFVTNLLEQLDAALAINRKRVYAAGFSSGGRFSQWMAATWTNVFAGIAPVCSQIGWNDPITGALVAPPAPLEPLPVFIVRGSLDVRQPYFGGTNDTGHLTFSAADDLAFWASGSACVGAPTVTTVGVVQQTHYGTCGGGYEVQLEGVSGLGHEWPESAAYNASLRIVDFLLQFTRP